MFGNWVFFKTPSRAAQRQGQAGLSPCNVAKAADRVSKPRRPRLRNRAAALRWVLDQAWIGLATGDFIS